MESDRGVDDVVDVESVDVVDIVYASLILKFCRLCIHQGWNLMCNGTDAILNNIFRI